MHICIWNTHTRTESSCVSSLLHSQKSAFLMHTHACTPPPPPPPPSSQLTPLPLSVPGVSQPWWTLCCPVRLVDSLRKAPHWLNESLSCSQCQLKVSPLTLIPRRSQGPLLWIWVCYYYFISADSAAYIIHKDCKPIIDTHLEFLSPVAPLKTFAKAFINC